MIKYHNRISGSLIRIVSQPGYMQIGHQFDRNVLSHADPQASKALLFGHLLCCCRVKPTCQFVIVRKITLWWHIVRVVNK